MELRPEDIIVQTYRKSGQCGWILKPENCVKLYHVPSGITTVSEDERSVFKNKVVALHKLEEELCWVEYEEGKNGVHQ